MPAVKAALNPVFGKACQDFERIREDVRNGVFIRIVRDQAEMAQAVGPIEPFELLFGRDGRGAAISCEPMLPMKLSAECAGFPRHRLGRWVVVAGVFFDVPSPYALSAAREIENELFPFARCLTGYVDAPKGLGVWNLRREFEGCLRLRKIVPVDHLTELYMRAER
jgi:hypothetical protein